MYRHATGTIPDRDKLEPYCPRRRASWPNFTLGGPLRALFRLSDRPGCPHLSRPHLWEEAAGRWGACPSQPRLLVRSSSAARRLL